MNFHGVIKIFEYLLFFYMSALTSLSLYPLLRDWDRWVRARSLQSSKRARNYASEVSQHSADVIKCYFITFQISYWNFGIFLQKLTIPALYLTITFWWIAILLKMKLDFWQELNYKSNSVQIDSLVQKVVKIVRTFLQHGQL